jgi:fumarate reductase iron-sulfur subunit
MAEKSANLEVFRYRPEEEAEPTFQTYEVPFRDEWVVLDALNWIKDNVDGTLSYRWSCRMGVCGSCGMMINGKARLSCNAFLREYHSATIRVEPLAFFAVERDLIIHMDDFMRKLETVKPWLIRREGEEKPLSEGEYRQSPAELAQYKQFSMCINCLLCYAACPVVGLEPEFTGPAAIALGHRYNLDSRDQGREERSMVLASDQAIWHCTFVGECSVVCPKNVDPAAAIQQEKVSSTIDWYKSLLMPWSSSGE